MLLIFKHRSLEDGALEPKTKRTLTYSHDYCFNKEQIPQKEKLFTSIHIPSNQSRLVLVEDGISKSAAMTVDDIGSLYPVFMVCHRSPHLQFDGGMG